MVRLGDQCLWSYHQRLRLEINRSSTGSRLGIHFGDVVNDGINGIPLTDANGDGFVDNWSTYRLTNGSNAVQISSKKGHAFSGSPLPPGMLQRLSIRKWLESTAEGDATYSDQWYVWETNTLELSPKARLKSTDQALEAGWESTFGDVIKIDGINDPSHRRQW